MFSVSTKIKLHYTDAAGVLFFGNYFKLIHDAYEEFLNEIDLDLGYIIDNSDYLLLIVHAEADYKKSLKTGAFAKVEIEVEKIGQTSFVLVYKVLDEHDNISATAKTVHVSVDKKSGNKIDLPEKVKTGFASIA